MANRDVGSRKKKKGQQNFVNQSPGKSTGPRKARKGPGIIAAILILVGSVVTVWGIYDYKNAAESRRWPKTTGTVIRSSVTQQQFGRENKTEVRYSPKIEYQYFVFGESFMADRIAFGGVSSGSLQSARTVVDRYPKGAEISVYYNPDAPSIAVLKAGYKKNALAKSVAGVLFFLMGLYVYRSWRRKIADL